MDPLLYNAMNGAIHTMDRQTLIGNNLANANTPGFKADMAQANSLYFNKETLKGGALVVADVNASDFTPGPLMTTGRDLDVAVQGEGWFAVQDSSGKEAYTRAGSFKINENGMLTTSHGLPVLGDGGPISIPPAQSIEIGSDGTITIVPLDGKPDELAVLDRLKLVKVKNEELIKGGDGLMRLQKGGIAPADADIMVVPGTLEGSNINPVNEMVNMIAVGREFDAEMQIIQTVNENSQKLAQILQI
ncbi:flagellar basal body rod protein FlgF [Legionella birminghamensis]|uniref:Flagellar basal-body rod protein FlgF n=1 Tax=Legionella birminghamensis TaxID=28083 RepID=A0A378I9M5_9GAMM|nr:flagellar basal-body rod protein FlgF [Legionella birminghamensis]KTC74682.1 flagellar basal body rod protein FlgF [Legionella birminghamensis]STX31485.1 flagellar basal-body rod protein FlgF [Legionella birminghamensis]